MTVLPAVTVSIDELLEELSRTLWKQRSLIEMLQYRLETQQIMCLSMKAERLQIAVDEVGVAMDEIRRSERTRDAVVRRCAQLLGLPESASLSDIRSQVGEPWSSTLADHQEALLALVNESERLSAMNRELALRGANDARSLMAEITGSKPATSYGPPTARPLAPPALVDWDA